MTARLSSAVARVVEPVVCGGVHVLVEVNVVDAERGHALLRRVVITAALDAMRANQLLSQTSCLVLVSSTRVGI
jgi:hypothetical protein